MHIPARSLQRLDFSSPVPDLPAWLQSWPGQSQCKNKTLDGRAILVVFLFLKACLAAGKLTSLLPARPVIKITSRLPAPPGPLEKSSLISPAQPSSARPIGKPSFICRGYRLRARPGPCRPLIPGLCGNRTNPIACSIK